MSRTILVVDDEPDIRELARLGLELVGGHHVVVADSGAAAAALVEEVRPDAVLLDVQMPGMDGPATLAALRSGRVGATVPVLFLTASVQEAQLTQLLELDVVTVLSKPFDPMTLPQQVDQALGWSS
ncbi:response regulator [Geodermatophilus obscurus]|uniref:Response regulator receiver protein n=1 Tax=Geodermatophilus obscurus (strain ATCC 25078 / DSM 43160 / JCM 3152 / CCUG 61914 / KCC A-0152 / KCTC 9177 / NBRC 13315 / NRRL B-3577 / G-20) TaxID=526225 RepID=D2SC77_GEOOG|nr:response regulator [Geodermatophilus obscurus]ADB74245.1 response regulator receiver protein [Geodermatophilus obscurus DSM 43160]